jgi:hypothetical protein
LKSDPLKPIRLAEPWKRLNYENPSAWRRVMIIQAPLPSVDIRHYMTAVHVGFQKQKAPASLEH